MRDEAFPDGRCIEADRFGGVKNEAAQAVEHRFSTVDLDPFEQRRTVTEKQRCAGVDALVRKLPRPPWNLLHVIAPLVVMQAHQYAFAILVGLGDCIEVACDIRDVQGSRARHSYFIDARSDGRGGRSVAYLADGHRHERDIRILRGLATGCRRLPVRPGTGIAEACRGDRRTRGQDSGRAEIPCMVVRQGKQVEAHLLDTNQCLGRCRVKRVRVTRRSA